MLSKAIEDAIRIAFAMGDFPGADGWGQNDDGVYPLGGHLIVYIDDEVLLERFNMEAHMLLKHPSSMKSIAHAAVTQEVIDRFNARRAEDITKYN